MVARRLAAIMATDVVGYSRLVGQDEAGTIARLKRLQHDVLGPATACHGGRLVKLMGDGTLVEFASAVGAVEAAAEIQRAIAHRENDRPEADQIRLRIGVNLGDVVVDGRDILGDGVNIATRLERLAEPGGICVSGIVHEQVRGRVTYRFEDWGLRPLKNIAEPVPVFAMTAASVAASAPHTVASPSRPRVRLRTVAATLAVAAALAGATWLFANRRTQGDSATSMPRLSIVVLPFSNLGDNATPQYFTEGISEDLSTDLARIGDSLVISPATARIYQGHAVDPKAVGHDLGVRYALEGSSRRVGERVRINARLVDTGTGAEVWADRFEADWTHPMEVQDEITSRLARTLDLALTDAEGRRAETRAGTAPDAVDLAMRGWSVLNRPLSKANLDEALPLLEEALRLDPKLPKAQVGVARTLAAAAAAHLSADPQADLARADHEVSDVLARLPNNAMAHFVRGEILVTRKQFDAAIDEYRAAIAANPSLAPAYGAIGRALTRAGRAAEALEPLDKAIQLSPHDPALNIWYFSVCHAHSHLAQDEAAIEWCNKAVALGPYWVAYVDLASAYAWSGRMAEAKAAVANLLSLKPGYTVARWANEGWSDNPVFLQEYQRLIEGLRKAGLPEA